MPCTKIGFHKHLSNMPLLAGLQHKSVSNSYTCVYLGDNSVCRPFPQT